MKLNLFQTQKKILIILVITLTGLLIAPSFAFAIAENQSINLVSVVLVYQGSCGDKCADLMLNVIPSLQSKFGTQLELIAIDSEIHANKSIIEKLLSSYQIPTDEITSPLFITDTRVLVGVDQIKNEADGQIRASFQSGGYLSPISKIFTSDVVAQQELVTIKSELETVKSELETVKSELDITKSELENTKGEAYNTRNFLFLVIIAGGLLFIVTLILVVALVSATKKSKSLQTRLISTTKKLTESEEKFVNTLIGQSTAGVDFLAEMVKVEFEYQKRRTISESAAFLARDFLIMVERYMAITPLAEYGTQVKYDPRLHNSKEIHKPGDIVWVVEPGWRRNNKVLKRALVRAS